MKKIIVVLSCLVFIASCGQSQSEIDAAKEKLLQDSASSHETEDTSKEQQLPEEEKETKKYIQIISQTEKQFLNFDTILESSLQTGEVKISGTTSVQVDKIEVLFSNPTSSFPNDDYTLQTFKAGDTMFQYFAASRHQVLDYGENNYIFRAYSAGEISETKIVLLVEKESEKEVKTTESQLIWAEDNTVLVDLPVSSAYGEPMRLWEASFTYTQIKGLEIQKEILDSVSCETLTDFLAQKMTSWYYWNTCRDIVKDKGIKFNVIRLEGEKYIYERHYIDFIHGFYGTYELETWGEVTSENIAEKNTLLKDQEFPSVEVVDELLKDIVNS